MKLVARCLLLLAALVPSGCAIHLRAPEADPVGAAPVAAPAATTIVTVVRLGPAELGGLLDAATAATARYGQRSAIVGQWSLEVSRAGQTSVRGQDDRLCLAAPLQGKGSIEVFGRRLDRRVDARIEVCARPLLLANGKLRLADPQIGVRVGDGRVELSSKVLADTLGKHVRDVLRPKIEAAYEAASWPIAPHFTPLLQALDRRFVLEGDGCGRLRPQRLEVGQPIVEDGGLRIPAALTVRPTLELPCVSAPPRAEAQAEVAIVPSPDLRFSATTLRVHVALSTERLTTKLRETLRARPPVAVEGGALHFDDVSLATAGGNLRVVAKVRGKVGGRWLGLVPVQRAVDGEVVVWGPLQVSDEEVALATPQLLLHSDDDVTRIAAALQRERLVGEVEKHARLPLGPALQHARKALAAWGRAFSVAGVAMPVRIDERSLRVEAVRAEAGRLVAVVAFVGHVVVGATPPQPSPPRP